MKSSLNDGQPAWRELEEEGSAGCPKETPEGAWGACFMSGSFYARAADRADMGVERGLARVELRQFRGIAHSHKNVISLDQLLMIN
jgi:hypothetical protein